ncbi:MAG: LysM peptidoglycan-binding domain-containing protein [Firmicutes bacterium]|nr:LysM peptidoglycan-binding domain-containing protein [Bacillota bacterium]
MPERKSPPPVRTAKPIKSVKMPAPPPELSTELPRRPKPAQVSQPQPQPKPVRQPQPTRTTTKYTPKRAKKVKKVSVTNKVSRKVKKARRFMRRTKIVGISTAVILLATMIFLIIWNITRDNAIAIYVGDIPTTAVVATTENTENAENSEESETVDEIVDDSEPIAFIALTEDMTESVLRTEAIRRLENIENARIVLSDNITIAATNTSSQNIISFDDAVNRLVDVLHFRILGVAIEVESNRVAVLRNQEDANELIRRLQLPYMSANEYVSVDFVEDFAMSNVDIDESQLSTIEQVLTRLEGDATVMEEYIVQPGDNLGSIALRHGITIAQLYEYNPGISSNATLHVGEVLTIQSSRPYLSVRTVEAITRIEEIPIETETISNPGESSTFSQVLRAGTAGEQEIVVHITRINGIQVGEEEVVATRVIQEMVTTTIEVGTL